MSVTKLEFIILVLCTLLGLVIDKILNWSKKDSHLYSFTLLYFMKSYLNDAGEWKGLQWPWIHPSNIHGYSTHYVASLVINKGIVDHNFLRLILSELYCMFTEIPPTFNAN